MPDDARTVRNLEIRTVPKRQRMRLAHAELLLAFAMTTVNRRKELLHEPGCGTTHPSEWADDDPMVVLARTYGLTFADLARLCDRIGDRLEAAAIRNGYDDHWDDPDDPDALTNPTETGTGA